MGNSFKKHVVHGKVDEGAKSLQQIQCEKQVTVHFTYIPRETNMCAVRIWPENIFLIDHVSGHRSKLIWFQNITAFPVWMRVPLGVKAVFTLVFEGLPETCTVFDFCEIIPEPGGFIFEEVDRNDLDIYLMTQNGR